jgi:hypothetical protein
MKASPPAYLVSTSTAKASLNMAFHSSIAGLLRRLRRGLAWSGFLLAAAAPAQPSVILTVDSQSPGPAIPADFCGLSFGAVAELPGHGGVSGLLFSPTNTQLIALFQNSGLHNLRLGGSTVEGLNAAVPDATAIDNVFAFARAVGDLKVIYSLRLLNGTNTKAAAAAQYIWRHYRDQLVGFAIGNEPDINHYRYPPFGTGTDPAITNYSSYLAAWRKFAAAVTNAAPGAHFAGPDAAGRTFASRFAGDEKKSGLVTLITQHFYVGGRPYAGEGTTLIPTSEAFDHMLSTNWVQIKYPALYHTAVRPVMTAGLPWRLTESDDYLKGVPHASDAFGSALWALDYLHWWAAHGCAGVNFHNTEWLTTDTVYLDASGHYQVNPKAYATKAFELGGRGRVLPLKLANDAALNLSAYAVGTPGNLWITIINKEHGLGARMAAVKIVTPGFSSGEVATMFLTAPDDNVAATNGITLGGAAITNNGPWRGRWTRLNSAANGECLLTVPPASAAIIKISRGGKLVFNPN